MGNESSSNGSGSDFDHCVQTNTLNGKGFMGASGDLDTIKCIIDRKVERAVNNISGVSSGVVYGWDSSSYPQGSDRSSDCKSNSSLYLDPSNCPYQDLYHGEFVRLKFHSSVDNYNIFGFRFTIEGYSPNSNVGTLRVFVARKFGEITGIDNQENFKVQNLGHSGKRSVCGVNLNYVQDDEPLSKFDVQKGDVIAVVYA